MAENEYANAPNMSRSEDIIQSILDNTEYDEAARSRIEYLLIELKNAIAAGGGGGSVTSYAPLTEKPKIDNHTLQAGNNTSSDLGLQTKLAFDSTPTENSTNPVTSGGVYTALGAKANSADVYNKSSVDTALAAKADKSTTYTKTEVETSLGTKQNTISDLSTIRSGAALGATAVQPVSGKGLSTNDYTTDEKNKLADIEAQANKTTVDSALSESSTNPVQNKVVKSALDSKQDALSSEQLDAVNSGITSTDVEQITTNENNILYNTNNGVKNLATINSFSFEAGTSAATAYRMIPVDATKSGSYTISIGQLSSTATGDKAWIRIKAADGTVYDPVEVTKGNNIVYTAILGARVPSELWVYPANSLSDSYSKTVTCSNVMVCLKSLYDADPTYQPYAMSNAELTAKEQQNEGDILTGLTLVAHTSTNGTTSLSYDTNINDFNIGGANSDKSSGSYLVICTNWSTTPAPYVGLLTFSGATSNKFVKTDVVTGFTPTITITQNTSNATIAISGAAKISIYATK